jgi:hypothetical protein
MSSLPFSTAHLDYLQRSDFTLVDLSGNASMTHAPVPLRRLWHIEGIGRVQKSPLSDGRQGPAYEMSPDQIVYLNSEDVLISLYGFKIPVAYIVFGTPGGIDVYLGTWLPAGSKHTSGAMVNQQQGVLQAALQGLYPAIDFRKADAQLILPPTAGLVLGIPTAKPPGPYDGALPLDRLTRAMAGATWTALVLAQPVLEEMTDSQCHYLINEMRATGAAEQAELAPSPLAEHYRTLLESGMRNMTHGQAVGVWRTAVYLLGDATSYHRLASVWRGVFSGDKSLPEPIRVWDFEQSAKWAANWAMPDVLGQPGPGLYQHPFQYQTLLTSSQLAAYIHLPQQETGGFRVQAVLDFDVVPPSTDGDGSVNLGAVIHHSRPTTTNYAVSLEALNRHALVAGVTGSGKTNTCFHLLVQLWNLGIPFLVIEPAKTEYRALLTHDKIGLALRIFTLGDESASPLRINPFEVEPGVSVSTHIDLLKSVFNASFGMWNPLPQVLERCIHAVYHDAGWDPIHSVNHRLRSGAHDGDEPLADAYPTLTDLYEKVDEVVDNLGYEARVTSDVKAALMTRLNSLRIGSKGVMLDTRRSIPISELLSRPTIIELEQIGDDDEKAFVIGLLLIKVYEHLRAYGSTEGTNLQHVVVIEEAHRLLANVPPPASQEQANTRGKAVETFANMLSEIRAYGEGFLVAEQIPSKLSPDVIKNTNLKVIHRIVAGDDRQLVAQTMSMSEQQSETIATLRTGQAAVFSEGDDRPILVGIPYAKIKAPQEMKTKAGSDQMVTTHMEGFRQQPHIASRYYPFEMCPQVCGGSYQHCGDAKGIVELEGFQEQIARLVLAIVLREDSVAASCRPLLAYVRSRQPQRGLTVGAMNCVALNGSRWYFSYFGQRYNWPYDVAGQLRRRLSALLIAAVPMAMTQSTGGESGLARDVAEFQRLYRSACERTQDPFPACGIACPSGDCLFRYQNEWLLRDRRLTELFDVGMAEAGRGDGWKDLRALHEAIARLIGNDASPALQRSAGLCYGVQQITFKPGLLDMARDMAIACLSEAVDAYFATDVADYGGYPEPVLEGESRR